MISGSGMAADDSKKVTQGIVFPKNSQGKRSSTKVVKKIFSETVSSLSQRLSGTILKEKKWRKAYPDYVSQLNEISIKNPQSAMTIAQNGLNAAHESIRFLRNDKESSLNEAMDMYSGSRFFTGIVKGDHAQSSPRYFSMPYKNKLLSGDDLLEQIKTWQTKGIFEPSFGHALQNVMDHPEWMDLSDRYFVLLGAGAEIGPLQTLLKFGANIIAVDLDRPDIWERLIKIARRSSGTLYIPMNKPFTEDMTDRQLAACAGADLIQYAPEIRTWIMETDKPLTIGSYAYLDGVKHIQIAMAMDAIIQDITSKRKNISLAFLLTPTDSIAVPMEASDHSMERFRARSENKALPALIRFLSRGTVFARNSRKILKSEQGKTYGLVNNILTQQGPSYMLAKNLHRWRSLVARNQGVCVSANMAPSTTTRSVFKNKLFAAAYAGFKHFDGEAFFSKTTNAMMTAALINDLNDEKSAANPDKHLDNPLELFMHSSNHGGLWRIAYQTKSVLLYSVMMGSLKALKKKLVKNEGSVQVEAEIR